MSLTVMPPKQRVPQLTLLTGGTDSQQPGFALKDAGGKIIELPDEAITLLKFVFEAWNHGHGVTVFVTSGMLTTQEAARWIGCSRQHVVSLMNSGVLPGRKIGTHRRIKLEDVLVFIDNERDRIDKEASIRAAGSATCTDDGGHRPAV